MRTLESIKEEIAALGEVDLFGTAKEVTHLPEILHDDESIKYLTSGLMDGTTWLIVCTQKRILLLDDIITTGATAGECARVLLTAGAKEIHCGCVAAARHHK